MSMCPNKNDEDWKVLAKVYGETAAYAVYSKHGLPPITSHPYYIKNKDKMPELKLVTYTLQHIVNNPEKPSYLIDSGEKSKIVLLRENELSQVNKKLSLSRREGDVKSTIYYAQKKKELEEEIEIHEKNGGLEAILLSGMKDLDKVRNLMDGDMTDAELTSVRRVLNLWSKGITQFIDQDELDMNTESREKLHVITGDANILLNKLKDMSTKRVSDLVAKTNNKGIVNTIMEDINRMKSNVLDISHINDSVIVNIFKSVKTANVKAKVAVSNRIEKLTNLYDKISHLDVYDMISQKYADGTNTGDLITKIKPEYYEEKNKLRSKYLKLDSKSLDYKKAKKDYDNFVNNNEITMDVRKFYGDKEGLEEHIQELKDLLGEEEYLVQKDKLDQKMQLFLERRQAAKDYFEASYPSRADELLYDWDMSNSPFVWMESLEGATFKHVNRGYTYTVSIPLQQWNDPRYKNIESNPALFEYYTYVMETLADLRQIIPEDKQKELRSNSLPFVLKDVAEQFDVNGFRAAATTWWDDLVKATRVADRSEEFYDYQDPNTGEIDISLRAPNIENQTVIKELFRKKKIQFKLDNGREPSEQEANELYKESKEEIFTKRTGDINKIITAYATMAEVYAHRAAVEDQIKLMHHYVNDMKEIKTVGGKVAKKAGEIVYKSDRESFANTKEAVGNFLDVVYYNKQREEEGITDKTVYTKEEKEEFEDLQDMIDSDIISEKEREFLIKKQKELGGKRAWSKIGDMMLKWVQLKGMGWNVIGGFSNLGFGQITNITHAAGNEDFSTSEYMKGYTLALKTLSKDGKKLANLVKKFDILKESVDYKSVNGVKKTMKYLAPYELTRMAEYMNQAPVLAAMMFKQNLWDKYDDNGNWIGEGEENSIDFKIYVDQIIKSLHGNYDPDSAVIIKKTIAGRAVTQFRMWMFEAFNNRFGEGKFDELLYGRESYEEDGKLINKKGRYLSYKKEHLFIIPALADFYKAFTNGIENEVDAANMRKNAVEVAIFLGLLSVMVMLSGGDDDDKKSYYRNMLVNQLLRLQTDISFYVDPMSFEALTKQSIPAMSVVTDTMQLSKAAFKFFIGKDEIEGGVYSGDSRILRELSQYFPGSAQIYRGYSTGQQVFKR